MKSRLVTALLLISLTGLAQTKKGDILVGVEGNILYDKPIENQLTKVISLSGSISYFVSDKLALGLQISESFTPYSYQTYYSNQLYGAGILARYYRRFSNKAGLAFHSSLTYNLGENDRPLSFFTPQYIEIIRLNQQALFYYFLTNRISIEVGTTLIDLNYTHAWNGGEIREHERRYSGTRFSLRSLLTNPVMLPNMILKVNYFISTKKQ